MTATLAHAASLAGSAVIASEHRSELIQAIYLIVMRGRLGAGGGGKGLKRRAGPATAVAMQSKGA